MAHSVFALRRDRVRLGQGRLFAIIFILATVYLAIGMYPISPIEGDGTAIANGATHLAADGLDAISSVYRYPAQPGTYIVVASLHRLLGVSSLVVFSVLSAVCSICFVFLSAAILLKLFDHPFYSCGMIVLLFQESFSGGYYANSTVIAAAVFMFGTYILTFSATPFRLLIGAIFLAIGVWIRLDVVLIFPAILLILYRIAWGRSLFPLLIVVGVVCFFCTVAIYASRVSINDIFLAGRSHLAERSARTQGLGIPLIGTPDVKSYLSFFSLLILFLQALGIAIILKQQRWYILGLFLAGVVPFYLIFSGVVSSPKYLYYLIPFFSIPLVSLAMSVTNRPRRTRVVILASGISLFILQYVIGLRAYFADKQYIEQSYSLARSHPTLVTLLGLAFEESSIQGASIVIGAGTLINTADNIRLSSGIAFSPLTWNHQKRLLNKELEKFSDYLEIAKNEPVSILATQWDAQHLAHYILLSQGYNCRTDIHRVEAQRYICRAEDGREAVIINFNDGNYNTVRSYAGIQSAISLIESPKRVVLLATYPWEQDIILQHREDWREVPYFAYELLHIPSNVVGVTGGSRK